MMPTKIVLNVTCRDLLSMSRANTGWNATVSRVSPAAAPA